jgi:heat shock protein HtpX
MSLEKRGLFPRMVAALGAVLGLNLLFVGLLAALSVPWLLVAAQAVGINADWQAWAVAVGVGSIVAAGVVAWLQARYARRRILSAIDGVSATEETHPELIDRVRRLAALADVPVPDVVIAESDAPNSFTVGSGETATIVVTEGLLSEFDEEQLDAVLAHELAHLLNRDAAVMTLVSLLPSLLTGEGVFGDDRSRLLALVAGYALASLAIAGLALDSAAVGGLLAVLVVGVLGSLLLGVVVAPVLVAGYRLSWDRELVADRAAARLTGDPAALATAIERLTDDPVRPETDTRVQDSQLRPLCIVPFDTGEPDPTEAGLVVDAPTHPPVTRRVENLRSVTADIEG